MSSLRISLASPATLEHLEFNIWFGGGSDEFYFEYWYDYAFYDALRDADVWTQLDSIATHPTGSRLQRVDIGINYYFDDHGEELDKDKISKAVLDGLPLLRKKGILFVKPAWIAKSFKHSDPWPVVEEVTWEMIEYNIELG